MESCRVLNETFKKIMQDSLTISPDSPNKAYLLNIYYREINSTDPDQEILKTAEGEFKACKSKIGGVRSISSDRGNIEIELEICRG
jgi:hypothetical protein